MKAGRSEGQDPVKQFQKASMQRITNDEDHRKAFTVSILLNEYLEKYAKVKKMSWREQEAKKESNVVDIQTVRRKKVA